MVAEAIQTMVKTSFAKKLFGKEWVKSEKDISEMHNKRERDPNEEL